MEQVSSRKENNMHCEQEASYHNSKTHKCRRKKIATDEYENGEKAAEVTTCQKGNIVKTYVKTWIGIIST